MSETTQAAVFRVNGVRCYSYHELRDRLAAPIGWAIVDWENRGFPLPMPGGSHTPWWWGNAPSPDDPDRYVAADGTDGLPVPLRAVRAADEDAELDVQVYNRFSLGGGLHAVKLLMPTIVRWIGQRHGADPWEDADGTRYSARELRARLPLRDWRDAERDEPPADAGVCEACGGEGEVVERPANSEFVALQDCGACHHGRIDGRRDGATDYWGGRHSTGGHDYVDGRDDPALRDRELARRQQLDRLYIRRGYDYVWVRRAFVSERPTAGYRDPADTITQVWTSDPERAAQFGLRAIVTLRRTDGEIGRFNMANVEEIEAWMDGQQAFLIGYGNEPLGQR